MSLNRWLTIGSGLLLATPAAAAPHYTVPPPAVDIAPVDEPTLFRTELGFSTRVFFGQPLLGASVELELGRHYPDTSVAGVVRIEAGSGLHAMPYQVVTTGAQLWSRRSQRLWLGGGPVFGALLVHLPYTNRTEWSILVGGNFAISVRLARAGSGQLAFGARADVGVMPDAVGGGGGPLTVAGTLSLGYHL